MERKPGQWRALSPLRQENTPSLDISLGQNGQVIFFDFGDNRPDLAERMAIALGLTMQDLWPVTNGYKNGNGVKVNSTNNVQLDLNAPDAIYNYITSGVLFYQVLRFEKDTLGNPLVKKEFRQRAANGQWSLTGVQRILYRLPELHAAKPDTWVFLCEGEKDVDRLVWEGLIATTNVNGGQDWQPAYTLELAGRRVCILEDNDQAGRDRTKKLCLELHGHVTELKVLTAKELGVQGHNHADITDALDVYRTIKPEDLITLAESAPAWQPPQTAKVKWEADELMTAVFPPPKWFVEGLLTVGLGTLAGRPKLGKSWLLMSWAIDIARGGQVLGKATRLGKILYLALEDNPRRLQDRLKKLGYTSGEGITFFTKWPDMLRENGIQELREKITNDNYQFVVIDTVERSVLWGRDKEEGIKIVYTTLHAMAHDLDVAILLIDHHRKSGMFNAGDVVDEVMGSTGKVGPLDVIIGLHRVRGEDVATLKVTGRDIDEVELAIQWDKINFSWKNLGSAQQVVQNNNENEIIQAIMDFGGEATASEIIGLTAMPKTSAYRILTNLVKSGRLEQAGKGHPYKVPRGII